MNKALDRQVGTTAFGADVAGYAAGRLDYPDALFDWLTASCGLVPGAAVLEIGPGTGQATRRLLDAGAAHVVAVEPDRALAAYLGQWGARRLEVRNLPFGADIADDGRFDLIVAATSFHWLECGPALAHAHRLLRRDGHFAMWWNVFHDAEDDPLFEALFAGLSRPPSLVTGLHYSLDTLARCEELAAAGFVDVQHVTMVRRVPMTPASLRALYATFSAVRQLPAVERAERLDMVEAMARRDLGDAFDRAYRTPFYSGRSPL